MKELHENAERIWKVLTQFPDGTTAKRLQQITSLNKTAVYNALKELRENGFVANEKRVWKIIEKPKSASRVGFFDWLEHRGERKENERITKQLEREREKQRNQRELMATIEEMFLDETDPDFQKKLYEIKRKYGLLGEVDKKRKTG